MPLIKSKSNKAFGENVKKEEEAGKKPKQAEAIAFAEKREAEKKPGIEVKIEVKKISPKKMEEMKKKEQDKTGWTKPERHK